MFKIREGNFPSPDQELVVREPSDTEHDVTEGPAYARNTVPAVPARKDRSFFHKKRQPRAEIMVHRLPQLDALPKIKAEHFDHGSLLNGMDVADGKFLSASQDVPGEVRAVAVSDREEVNRGTEQNGNEEDERNQYEVLSVQGSHTLLLQKERKEAFRRRPPG